MACQKTSQATKRLSELQTPTQRSKCWRTPLQDNISDARFIPYLQLHEFEALLLSDPRQLKEQFPDKVAQIRRLVAIADSYGNPELIDDNPNTAPSKRIIAEIPEFAGMKPSAGPITALKIGLPNLRSSCLHFDEWVRKLELL